MRNLLTIFAVWAAGLGAAAQFGKISVAFAELGAAYAGQSAVMIGLMVSVVGTVGLIFGTTAGLVVARVGARRAMLAALVLGAAVSAVQALLPPFPVMMATRVLEGVSHLAIVVVGPVAIAEAAGTRWQGAAMTLWSSFFGVTYAFLFWIGPWVLAAGPGPLFLGHALWMLAIAAVLSLLMPRVAVRAVPPGAGVLAQHAQIYASPWLAAPAMGFVCYTVTYVAILTLLPPALSLPWVGVAMPLVSIAVSLTLGVWLLGVMPAVRLVQAGFAVAVLAGIGFALGEGVPRLAAALVIAAALGVVQGASFAALAQLNPAPEDRARAAGAIAQLGNLGTVTGTPMLALIMEKAGMTGLSLFVLGFSGLGIVIHAWQEARRRQARSI
ncbi:MFS transporter [Aliigemmobacter aestuarii]|uniref:MFS transporter n=1 Tax=Aliigemmobacter aestuarii TaxID=1445661 RepID=A0A4S3MP97_9RHOB|nr:MFS transporter [Gemmobacter aestuarii]THD84199.1 MFS transporter [Gemmobacter aestuarii]